jgi:DNA-binding transcriptional MocR family regulator
MPPPRKQAMVELLARHQVPLIEDDVYGELYFGLNRPPPAKAYDQQGLVMHCSSFSKCLAPGYRVGWVAAGRFAGQVQRLKLMTTLSTAIPSQLAISDFLQGGGYERHLRQLRLTLAAQQALALRLIADHFPAGTRVTRPQGGYFLWLELPAHIDTLRLLHLALAQRISVAPGHLFSADRRFGHCLRLNYGYPGDPRFENALKSCWADCAFILMAVATVDGMHPYERPLYGTSTAKVSFLPESCHPWATASGHGHYVKGSVMYSCRRD